MGLAAGFSVPSIEAQAKNVLAAKKVAAEPALDGSLDAAWNGAQSLTVKAVGGKNLPGGSTDITLRAVYTADTIYFHVQYKDATQSVQRSPWVKQADGSWKKLKDPDDKGGDNNVLRGQGRHHLDDQLAIVRAEGLHGACHTGEAQALRQQVHAAPARGGHLAPEVACARLDRPDRRSVPRRHAFDKDKAPEAGRKCDPKTGGGYADNVNRRRKGPSSR